MTGLNHRIQDGEIFGGPSAQPRVGCRGRAFFTALESKETQDWGSEDTRPGSLWGNRQPLILLKKRTYTRTPTIRPLLLVAMYPRKQADREESVRGLPSYKIGSVCSLSLFFFFLFGLKETPFSEGEEKAFTQLHTLLTCPLDSLQSPLDGASKKQRALSIPSPSCTGKASLVPFEHTNCNFRIEN